MSDVNVWTGNGRLTSDAELSMTRNNKPKLKFRIANNGRTEDDTIFLDVLVFGDRAKALEKHLTKGRAVTVQGKLDVRFNQDTKKQSTAILADNIHLGHQPENNS